jgi:hypothetical protein
MEDKQADYMFTVNKISRVCIGSSILCLGRRSRSSTRPGKRGHGRHDIHRLQMITCTGALALDFRHAVQALRIRRRQLNLATGRWSTVTVYAITNLTAAQAGPADLADWLREH